MATPTLDPKTSDTVQALVQLLRSRSSEEIRQRMYDNPPGSPWWAACKTELDLRNSERAATALVDTSRVLDKLRSATDHLDELTGKLVQVDDGHGRSSEERPRIRPADGNCDLRDRRIDHRAAVLYSLPVFRPALALRRTRHPRKLKNIPRDPTCSAGVPPAVRWASRPPSGEDSLFRPSGAPPFLRV